MQQRSDTTCLWTFRWGAILSAERTHHDVFETSTECAYEPPDADVIPVPVPVGVEPLPTADGLSTQAVLSLLSNAPASVCVLDSIPRGLKNNVCCCIRRNTDGCTNQFIDDCGVSDSNLSNYNSYPYTDVDGTMRRIYIYDNNWIAATGLSKARQETPIHTVRPTAGHRRSHYSYKLYVQTGC